MGYQQVIASILTSEGAEVLLTCLNEDIYHNLPTPPVEGAKFERYKYLYSFIRSNVELAHDVATGENKKQLTLLLTHIRALDAFGLNIHITPDMSNDVIMDCVHKLDEEKVLFTRALKNAIDDLRQRPEALRTMLAFARLCYRFNEYTAPPRTSREEAHRDAMGVSDHYQELVDSLM